MRDAGSDRGQPGSRLVSPIEFPPKQAPGANIVEAAEQLLDGSLPVGPLKEDAGLDPQVASTLELVVALRRNAFRDCTETVYALLLMDYLLIQIGGIAFGSTGNKIESSHDAVRAFAFISKWLVKLGVA